MTIKSELSRIGDLLERWQLAELLRMADAGTGTIGEHLKEWEAQRSGHRLRELRSEAVRPARVAARNGGGRVGGPIPIELPNKRRD